MHVYLRVQNPVGAVLMDALKRQIDINVTAEWPNVLNAGSVRINGVTYPYTVQSADGQDCYATVLN